jgi:flagellar assembly factor FliW
MPTIRIQGTELSYTEADIITFDEGMIGLPRLRRMVLVSQSDITPFLWLFSLDDPEVVFLVIEPHALFPDYAPRLPASLPSHLGVAEDEAPLVLAIVLIAADWTQSTINLRAPIIVAPGRMRGAQVVLTESAYRVAEPLASESAAGVGGEQESGSPSPLCSSSCGPRLKREWSPKLRMETF